MAKRVTVILAVLILQIFVVFPTAAPALGISGFNLYRPGAKNPDAAFHFNLQPGQTIEDQVVIKNTSDSVQNLRVYVADGVAVRNGGISLKDGQDKRRGLAKWITIDSPPDLQLAPGEERHLWFKLTVPASSDVYEKIAGIVVERQQVVPGNKDARFVINILPRVAILITQRLPGAAVKRLDIVSFNETWSTKRNKLFNLAVKNSGTVHLQPKGRLDVYGTFGGKIDSISLERMATIFPRATSRVSTVWKNTPSVGYFRVKARVSYDNGKSDSKQIAFLIFPYWTLPVLLALWIIARQQRKRRAARRLKKLADEQALAETTALETLAETVNEIAEEVQLMPAAKTAESAATPKKPRATAKKKSVSETAAKPAPRKRAPVKKTDPAAKPARPSRAKKTETPEKKRSSADKKPQARKPKEPK